LLASVKTTNFGVTAFGGLHAVTQLSSSSRVIKNSLLDDRSI
jgi:hypothetical protein